MEKTQKKDMSPVRDMTSGNPLSLILAFAVPMLMGTLFQQFYSMVDTIIVGKFLGVDALASVGSTGAVNFMVNGFVIGVTAGFAIPVAQQFGAQNYRNMRKYVANTIWLTIGFSVVMTAVIGALTWKILVWMRTPENIIQGAYNYIFIIFLGIPVTYLYNLTASIIRALGDSKTPVYFLILSSLVNIVLDYISINFLGMGVAGPACATVISQGLSGILCVLYMKKKFTILHFQKGEMEFDGRMCLNLCNMGIPMGLQYSITAIGSVILQTAVNTLAAPISPFAWQPRCRLAPRTSRISAAALCRVAMPTSSYSTTSSPSSRRMLAARASATPLPSNDRKRRRARICSDPPYGLNAQKHLYSYSLLAIFFAVRLTPATRPPAGCSFS